eukprot:356781-Chlamydomonas_euryale.AAC.11
MGRRHVPTEACVRPGGRGTTEGVKAYMRKLGTGAGGRGGPGQSRPMPNTDYGIRRSPSTISLIECFRWGIRATRQRE